MFGKRTRGKPNLDRALQGEGIRAPVIQKKSRHGQRMETWSQCLIRADGGVSLFGIVIDHSEDGARIRFRGRQGLPQYVTLSSQRLGTTRSAEVVWQERGDAGLRFI